MELGTVVFGRIFLFFLDVLLFCLLLTAYLILLLFSVYFLAFIILKDGGTKNKNESKIYFALIELSGSGKSLKSMRFEDFSIQALFLK
jgi:hypothetical protein